MQSHLSFRIPGSLLLSVSAALLASGLGSREALAQTSPDAIISPPSVIAKLQAEIEALQKTVGSQSAAITGLQATVSSQAGEINSLQTTVIGQGNTIGSLESTVSAQTGELSAVQSQANDSSKITDLFTLGDGYGSNTELTLTGVNLDIVDGLGATDTVNGVGNLVLGYNAPGGNGGSHNLVLGRQNSYSSFGGIVDGVDNAISGAYATVLGGHTNQATGDWSFVYGGLNNLAAGQQSSITGGSDNEAYGIGSTITGGVNNTTGQPPTDGESLLAMLDQPSVDGEFTSVTGGYSVVVAASDSSTNSGAIVVNPAPINTGIITIKP